MITNNNSSKPTLKDMVYHQIIEMICNGQLHSDSIITEKQLTEHFGISKSPVREALIQLCHDHVLISIPRCGYQVIKINAKDIHDLTELRLMLELGNLSRLAERVSPELIQQLNILNQERELPISEKDVWSSWNRNILFHMRLVESSGNEYLIETMRRTLSACSRAYAQLYIVQKEAVLLPERDSDAHSHVLITQALGAHQSEDAQNLLKKDILCMESQLLSRDYI